MRYFLLIALFSLFSISVYAQPVNDECDGIIDLGVVPLCPSDIYTNVDATASDIGNDNIPDCFNGGNVDRDVWFQFTTDGTIVDYTITVTGVADAMGSTPMSNPQIEIYRGAICGFDELAALQVCASANNGDAFVSTTVFDLDPNEVYYMRINDYTASASPNSGSFEFCITEYIPDVNICDGTGSTSCSGTIYDCGGPDGDYGTNENFVYTICPNEFHECILLDVVDFNIEFFDVLNVYGGDDINAPLIASLSGAASGSDFQIQASSNCVTLEFLSDGFAIAPGFEIDWLCVSFPCDGSSETEVEVIPSIPFNESESTCSEASTIGESPCPDDGFLGGPDYFYTFDSPGDLCVEISISNAAFGTGVLVLNGPPSDPSSTCVAVGENGMIPSVNMEDAGTYYIIVANAAGCTDFNINIVEAECNLSPALVDALCNPLNGCQEFDPDGNPLPSVFNLDVGFEDLAIVGGVNNGCYGGVGAGNFYWFTIQAQAVGPFGFIVDGENFASDIDFNVWGPFTEDEVCETPNDVITFIETNQPIRSSWAGGADPTGLADIHPGTGIDVTDEYDCNGNNDDFVRTIDALTDEVYVVLVNDWGGQIVDGVIMVDWSPSDPAVLETNSIDIVGSDTTLCTGESVQLEIDAAVDDIVWISNTSTLSCTACPNPVASPIETTVYEVAVSGVCIADTVEVTVEVFGVDAGPDFTVCLGEDVQFNAGADFDVANYEWTGMNLGDLSCTDCPDPVLTTTSAGTFTYTVSLTGPTCVLTDEVEVTVLTDPAPMFDMVSDSVFLCAGEMTNLGQAGNDASFGYTWTSDPPGFSSSDPDPSVTPTESTMYYVAVTSTFCPVTSLDSVYVDIQQLPILNLSADTTVCEGESVTLGSTLEEPGVTYQWSPSTGLDFDDIANPVATIDGTETYTLTATIGGCVSTETITVTSTVISIGIQNPDSLLICKGEEVNLSAIAAPSGIDVVWTPSTGLNQTTGLNVIASPDIATTYFASVNVPGCVQFDSIYIDVDSIPYEMTILPSDTTVCQGAFVVLQSQTYEQNDFPEIDHQWMPPGDFQSPDSLYNIVVQANETTTYIRTTNNGICSQIDTARITVEPTATIEIVPQDTMLCDGGSVQLLASSDLVTEFEWSSDDGDLSCTECPDPIGTVNGPGNYVFTASGEFEGCPTSNTTTIQVVGPPDFSLTTDDDYCPGDSPISLNNANPDSDATYMWSSSPTDPTLDINASNPEVTPTATTTYSVTVTNNVCDPITQEFTITVDNVATVTISDDLTICSDETAPLFATTTGDPDNLSWSNNVTGVDNPVSPDQTTTYTLTYDDGCNPPIVNMVTVSVEEGFTVDIIPASIDTTFAEGDVIDFTAVTTPPLVGATYDWSTGQTGATITTTVTESGSVTYSVTVTSSNLCDDEASETYDVTPAISDTPNAFTPNGDGVSDYFNVLIKGNIEVLDFKVYSRWGQVVYDNETPDTGWDGMKDEKALPADVYFYQVVTRRASGEEEVLSGDVTLIR